MAASRGGYSTGSGYTVPIEPDGMLHDSQEWMASFRAAFDSTSAQDRAAWQEETRAREHIEG